MLCMSRYAPTLEDMYTQMEQRQKERQSAMRDAAAQGSISDKVKQVGPNPAAWIMQCPVDTQHRTRVWEIFSGPSHLRWSQALMHLPSGSAGVRDQCCPGYVASKRQLAEENPYERRLLCTALQRSLRPDTMSLAVREMLNGPHPRLVLKLLMSMQAAAVTLGIDPAEMGDGSSSFNQLGGDSLAAIQFAREVDELCGTTLPVSFVLDHSHSMQDIIEKVSCAAPRCRSPLCWTTPTPCRTSLRR